MRFRKIGALVMTGALAVLGTACSEDEVGSREDVVAMFEEEGLSTVMAECLADATIEEFGLDTMNERRDLTEAENTKVGELTTGCIEEVGLENVTATTAAP